MNDIINDDNLIKIVEYCDKNKVSVKEGVNNILAEYFLERERRIDDEK